MNETDLAHLKRTVALAKEALEAGDEPFGSVLVDVNGHVCMEDRNRVAGGDHTRHPEFEIARWAANNMTPEQRAWGYCVYLRGALPYVRRSTRMGRFRSNYVCEFICAIN